MRYLVAFLVLAMVFSVNSFIVESRSGSPRVPFRSQMEAELFKKRILDAMLKVDPEGPTEWIRRWNRSAK
ncbi:hypothetical protein PRIPAC_78123 [Pristionchus pacificus]|uniref:Uncharacterized protein n=1 Tax=Pristionchus pacificus TaxID=54126 RepID=A0A8R1UD11_PRIPA|nr:hypothetical protein PRIPAC_78123 [Pristionchus pacificus]